MAIGVAGWLAVSLFGAVRRGAFAVALAGVALALLAGQYALGVRPAIGYLQDVDDKFATVPDKAGGRTWCVNEPGLPDLPFLRAVRDLMPEDARYQLFVAGTEDQLNVPLCVALIMAPRTQVLDAERADYAIFLGAIPEEYERQAREGAPGYHFFAPALGILELPR